MHRAKLGLTPLGQQIKKALRTVPNGEESTSREPAEEAATNERLNARAHFQRALRARWRADISCHVHCVLDVSNMTIYGLRVRFGIFYGRLID